MPEYETTCQTDICKTVRRFSLLLLHRRVMSDRNNFFTWRREKLQEWCYWQRQWERWWWWWWSCRITNKTVVCLCIRPNMRTFDMKWRWIDGIPLLFLIEDFLGCVENIARWNSADNGLMGQLILRHLFPVWKLSSQKKVFFALIVLNCV